MDTKRIAAASIAAIALIATLSAGSCDDTNDASKSVQAQGQADTVDAFKRQSAAVPYPKSQLLDSLERRNIRERLLRTNKPNAISYVYLLGDTGTYIGYYVIKGKVSSTQSQMTADEFELYHGNGNGGDVVSAPGDDGSYGANEDGIFFFTAEGVMVETSMRYVVSDAPLNVNAPRLNVPKR